MLDHDWIDYCIERRKALHRLQPKCPACGDGQVQLMNAFVVPAQWRCRICKTKFQADVETKPG